MTVNFTINRELFVALPIFIIGIGSSFGLFGDIAFAEEFLKWELYNEGDITYTMDRVLAIGSLLFILFNREKTLRETKGVDVWVVYATIVLIVAPPIFPFIQETLAEGVMSWITFFVSLFGFFFASAIN